MRLALLLCITVCAAAAEAELKCENLEPPFSELRMGLNMMASMFGPTLFENTGCNTQKIIANITSGRACGHLINSGICYMQRASELFMKEGDALATFGDLSIGMDDMGTMMEVGCDDGRDCYDNLKSLIYTEGCYKPDSENSEEDLRTLFRTNLQNFMDQVKVFIIDSMGPEAYEEMWESYGSDGFIGNVLNEFGSVDAIAGFVDSKTTDDMKDDLEDFSNNARNTIDAFCDAKCYGPTAGYFKGLFAAMHHEDTCPSMWEGFCEDCFDNGSKFVRCNKMPECTEDAADNIIKAVTYVEEEYADEIEDLGEKVNSMDSEGTVQTAVDAATEQFECIEELYTMSVTRELPEFKIDGCCLDPEIEKKKECVRGLIRDNIPTLLYRCTNSYEILEILQESACQDVFNQGTCFAQEAFARYYTNSTATYQMLSEDMVHVADLAGMGCTSGMACYEGVRDAVFQCIEDDFENSYEKFAEYIRTMLNAAMGGQGGKGFCGFDMDMDMGTGFLGTAKTYLQETFPSLDSVVSFAEEKTDGKQDKMMEDFKTFSGEARSTIDGFCGAECYLDTAVWLEGFFGNMHDEGTCPNVDAVFCDGCFNNSLAYVEGTKMPCCAELVAENIIEGVEYVKEEYSDEVKELNETLAKLDVDDLMGEALSTVGCIEELYKVSTERDTCCLTERASTMKECVRGKVQEGVSFFLQGCQNVDAVAQALKEDSCQNVFNKGTCFVQEAFNRYNTTSIPTFKKLADDMPMLNELMAMGCEDGRACYDTVKGHVLSCIEDNFGNNMTDFGEYLKTQLAIGMAAMEASDEKEFCGVNLDQDMGDGLLGNVQNYLQEKFTSVEDIFGFVEEETTDQMKKDLEEFSENARTTIDAFCDAYCYENTTDFFEGLFDAMHDQDCADVTYGFCDACKANAKRFVRSRKIPCCAEDAAQNIIKAVNYVQAEYADQIEELTETVEGLDTSEGTFETGMDVVTDNFKCIEEIYNESKKPLCDDGSGRDPNDGDVIDDIEDNVMSNLFNEEA